MQRDINGVEVDTATRLRYTANIRIKNTAEALHTLLALAKTQMADLFDSSRISTKDLDSINSQYTKARLSMDLIIEYCEQQMQQIHPRNPGEQFRD